MANKYLAIRIGDIEFNLGAHKLGFDNSVGAGKLVIPDKNSLDQLIMPGTDPEVPLVPEEPLGASNTAENTAFALKGSDGDGVFIHQIQY